MEMLTVEDFARLFGVPVADLPPACVAAAQRYDFSYSPLDDDAKDRVLVTILRSIDAGAFTLAGADGKGRWDRGWDDVLRRLRDADGDTAALVPDYIRPRQPVRLDGRYVMPTDPEFELHWYDVFQEWILGSLVGDTSAYSAVYELGCGSGINLAKMARINPAGKYIGLDWAPASSAILDYLRRRHGWDVSGWTFDFFNPSGVIAEGALILTIGALEQTGRQWRDLLDFILAARPALCVHVEPVVEWYTNDTLFDYAAIRFHRARKYWEGFHDRLVSLERSGQVEILKQKRSGFGSLYLEGYSQTIWRPR